jgi:hypothetical protein
MANTKIGGQTPHIPAPVTPNVNETASEISRSSAGDPQTSVHSQESATTQIAQKQQATESKVQQRLCG